jgi:purine-cytosine permease-like protein
VWLCDGILRHWRFDLKDIHPEPGAARARRKTGAAWGAYAVGMTVAALTMKSPLYQGPINRLLGGMDLSWVFGLLSAAAAFALFRRRTDCDVTTQSQRPSAEHRP